MKFIVLNKNKERKIAFLFWGITGGIKLDYNLQMRHFF